MGDVDEGVCGVLNRVIKKGLTGKMIFLQKSEGGEGVSQADLWERAFQADRTAGAKALRWGLVHCNQGGEEAGVAVV